MKKPIFFLFYIVSGAFTAAFAQSSSIDTLPALPKILLKASVGALAEHATCLHLSIENRPFRQLGLQAELGYYSDFLRNKSYNINTSSFNGLRLGGELRYYFVRKGNQFIQPFIALSYVTNITNARSLENALILQNGIFVETQTPIAYQHRRTFYDVVSGVQAFFNPRFSIDMSFGVGMVERKVTNVEVFDKQALLFSPYYNPGIIFPSNTLWTPSGYLDYSSHLNLAANIKIGYRLF
jgi:hypothetical protein